MSGVSKEGFLFVKILTGNSSQLTAQVGWSRRWLQLYSNGVLKCYDSCYAEQLVFRYDLMSLHVSADDLVYPDGVSGKPWIISVGMKERGEKLLLEADCEECMERWAESMTRPLAIYITYESSAICRDAKPPVKIKPRLLSKPKLRTNLSPHETEKDLGVSEAGDESSRSLTDRLSYCQEFGLGDLISNEIYDDIVNAVNKPNLTLSQYCNTNTPIELANFSSQEQPKPPALTPKKSFTLPKSQNVESSESPSPQLGNIVITRPRPTPPPRSMYHDYASVDVSAMLQDDYVLLNSSSETPIPENSQLTFPVCLNKLLNDYWLMSFILPNSNVYKQLIDLTLPIKTSLQPLLNCFDHSYTSPNAYLFIQVVGDLYQTYNTQNSSRYDKKKGTQSLDWKMSFSSQGVMTSKIVRIKLRVGVTAELNSNKLEEFLYRMNHLSESEFFCMSWVSFVKGNFPVLDTSVSARHSACIFLIYLAIPDCKINDVNQFVPSHLKKVISHMNSIHEEIRTMKCYDTLSICHLFLRNLRASRSGNAISLPVVIVKQLTMRLKYINCIFVVGNYHIGIVRMEKESLYGKLDTFSEFWHFSEIRGWSIISAKEIVFIMLAQRVKGLEKMISFLSPNTDFINYLFKQILCTEK